MISTKTVSFTVVVGIIKTALYVCINLVLVLLGSYGSNYIRYVKIHRMHLKSHVKKPMLTINRTTLCNFARLLQSHIHEIFVL